jgi:hypothetical protein
MGRSVPAEVSIQRQCELLGLARSSYYYQPRAESEETLALLRRLDELYMEWPFFGSRRMAAMLGVNRKRIERLMRLAGIEALQAKPRLSRPGPGLSLPGGGDGLVQPLRVELGIVDDPGHRLLPGGPGSLPVPGRRFSTPTRARNSLRPTSPPRCGSAGSGSAWTAAAAGWTVFSSSGCGWATGRQPRCSHRAACSRWSAEIGAPPQTLGFSAFGQADGFADEEAIGLPYNQGASPEDRATQGCDPSA